MIINSCKHNGVRDADIDTDPKNNFGYQILTLTHETDLIRCFDGHSMDRTFASIDKRLQYFLDARYHGAISGFSDHICC